jgi:hypothetical protein
LPGILALGFPQLPFWLRIAMVLYSATVAIPATGVLFALVQAASLGEHLSLELAIQQARRLALPSFRILTPLYGVFGVLIWLAVLLGTALPAVTTLATLAALLWYLCAVYWGPLLVRYPAAGAPFVAGRAVKLVSRYPAETLATGLVAAVALIIGLISIGGLFLIVPVVVALLHAQRYLDVMSREAAASKRG